MVDVYASGEALVVHIVHGVGHRAVGLELHAVLAVGGEIHAYCGALRYFQASVDIHAHGRLVDAVGCRHGGGVVEVDEFHHILVALACDFVGEAWHNVCDVGAGEYVGLGCDVEIAHVAFDAGVEVNERFAIDVGRAYAFAACELHVAGRHGEVHLHQGQVGEIHPSVYGEGILVDGLDGEAVEPHH